MNKSLKKGFTLVELLIVVAILAVLSTATVIILNPAQILQETRDTQRMNDLNTVNSALALYLANTASPTLGGGWRCTNSNVTTGPCAGAVSNAIRLVDGTGWVDVNLGTTSGINSLPLDPIGTQTDALHYTAKTDNTNKKWELTAQMESTKYSGTGTSDRESTDGGNNATCYEIGTDLTLVGAALC